MKKYRPVECPVTNPTAIALWWQAVDATIVALRDRAMDEEYAQGKTVFIPDDEPEDDDTNFK